MLLRHATCTRENEIARTYDKRSNRKPGHLPADLRTLAQGWRLSGCSEARRAPDRRSRGRLGHVDQGPTPAPEGPTPAAARDPLSSGASLAIPAFSGMQKLSALVPAVRRSMSRRLRQNSTWRTSLKLLSLTQVAARLGICRRTIERSIEMGNGPAVVQISARRVGVTEADYQLWFKSLRRPARRKAKVARAA